MIKRFIGSSFRGFHRDWQPDERSASGSTRKRLRVFRRAPVEDHEQAQLLIGGEAVLGAGLDEDGRAFGHRHRFLLYLEHPASFEDDVDLVVFVGLLAVGFGSNEDVDAELLARRLVDDLVAAAGGYETILDLRDAECRTAGDPTRRR